MKLLKFLIGVIMLVIGSCISLLMIVVFIQNTLEAYLSHKELGYKIGSTIGGLLAVLILVIIPYLLIKYGIKLLKSKTIDKDLSIDENL